MIILALGLTGTLLAVGAFGGLGGSGAFGSIKELYSTVGDLAFGSISLMRMHLFMRRLFHHLALTNLLASDHASLI